MSADPSQSARSSRRLHAAADSPAFSVTRSAMPDAMHVVLAGELDLATVPMAEHELRRALREAADVLLDLRALTFIDVAGLNMILAADRKARRDGRRLAVACQGARCVQRMFELTHADRPLTLVGDPTAPADSDGAGPRPG